MIVVGENLENLVKQKGVIDACSYDNFSLTLHLCKVIRRYCLPENTILDYNADIHDDWVEDIELRDEYILNPNDAILACSEEYVKMPLGYMGFLQTKGSLARLFVMAHCCDGQVEPGFEGRITFEICNVGRWPVKIHVGQPVSQLFIQEVSSNKQGYCGKYNKSEKPTYYIKGNEK